MAPFDGNYIESCGHLLINSGFIFTYLVIKFSARRKENVRENTMERRENANTISVGPQWVGEGVNTIDEYYSV